MQKLAQQYALLRAKKEQIKSEYDDKLRALDAALDHMETKILADLNQNGLKSARTDFGLFTKKADPLYFATDWAAFYDHIVDTKNFGLLQKRVGKGAIVEYLTEEERLPPGIDTKDIIKLHFTKPKE